MQRPEQEKIDLGRVLQASPRGGSPSGSPLHQPQRLAESLRLHVSTRGEVQASGCCLCLLKDNTSFYPPPPRHRQGAELQIRRLKAQSSQQTCWQAQLSEAPQGSGQVTARGRQAEQLARKPPWDIPGSTSLSSIPGAFPREPSLKIPDKSH